MYAATTFVTLSLAALGSALPAGRPAVSDMFTSMMTRATNIADQYTFYLGDGSTWPQKTQWGSFDDLWTANLPLIQQSCGWNSWGVDNSPDEINDMHGAIVQVAGETGIEDRFILAVVMQESKGCVRAPSTGNGVHNPGLMQSHNGSGDCAGISPCPQPSILAMIRDGTAGTPDGDGLQQTLAATSAVIGNTESRAVYAAARMYNSGSVDYTNLNNAFTSRGCYATDVANRLTGWTLATSSCNL
ncbi:hypothetical protein G7046_g4853 [Stylonectria norvegica]|nr:hypothetical protein G7046_g4853 [Stylonectria norvegica]